jgi:hypothetical protein
VSQPVRFSVKVVTFKDGAEVMHSSDAEGEYVLHADYAALQAENERLRKAGDAVVAAYCMGDKNVEKWKEYPVVRDWLAAKGVQP